MNASRKSRISSIVLALVAVPLAIGAAPHDTGQSYVFLTVEERLITGRFEIAVGDLNNALGLDFRTDGSVTLEDVGTHIDAIQAYILDKVKITSAEGPRPIHLGAHRLFATSFAQFVVIDFTLDEFSERPRHLDVQYAIVFDVDAEHRGILVIETNWKTGTFNNETVIALIFSPREREKRLDLSSSSFWRGFMSLVELGTHHIWVGIDHVLFLLALLLPAVLQRESGKWQPVGGFRSALINVITIVTLFTVAHSVTLSLAALNVIQLPSRLVESAIALSIAVAAVNIVAPIFKSHVLWVVLGFGLFHGLGFATVLSTMGIPGGYMPASLLGFNLGVELGQLVIVCLVFPALFLMRRSTLYTPYFVNIGAVLLILVSLYWFTERAFDIDIRLGAFLQRMLGYG